VTNGRRLNILMDGTKDEAVGFLVQGIWASSPNDGGSLSNF
jgi:hypothetical protein